MTKRELTKEQAGYGHLFNMYKTAGPMGRYVQIYQRNQEINGSNEEENRLGSSLVKKEYEREGE